MMNARGEARTHQVAILNANYDIECSYGFALSDRLPIEIENKVRELTMSWWTDEWSCAESYCVLAPGLFMRVFLLEGSEKHRVGVTLEPHDERAGITSN